MSNMHNRQLMIIALLQCVKQPSWEDYVFVLSKAGRDLPFALRAQIVNSWGRRVRKENWQ